MTFENPESQEQVTREQALAAYKPFIDKGITNPDHLDLDDPEVKAANQLFYKWQAQADTEAGDDEDKKIRLNLSKTMFNVDAGFTDPNYLDEVLKEWLYQDARDIEKDTNNPERVETRRLMAEAMKKVRTILRQE